MVFQISLNKLVNNSLPTYMSIIERKIGKCTVSVAMIFHTYKVVPFIYIIYAFPLSFVLFHAKWKGVFVFRPLRYVKVWEIQWHRLLMISFLAPRYARVTVLTRIIECTCVYCVYKGLGIRRRPRLDCWRWSAIKNINLMGLVDITSRKSVSIIYLRSYIDYIEADGYEAV